MRLVRSVRDLTKLQGGKHFLFFCFVFKYTSFLSANDTVKKPNFEFSGVLECAVVVFFHLF